MALKYEILKRLKFWIGKWKRLKCSGIVAIWHLSPTGLLLHVIACHIMSQHVTACHSMSHHVTACQFIPKPVRTPEPQKFKKSKKNAFSYVDTCG